MKVSSQLSTSLKQLILNSSYFFRFFGILHWDNKIISFEIDKFKLNSISSSMLFISLYILFLLIENSYLSLLHFPKNKSPDSIVYVDKFS